MFVKINGFYLIGLIERLGLRYIFVTAVGWHSPVRGPCLFKASCKLQTIVVQFFVSITSHLVLFNSIVLINTHIEGTSFNEFAQYLWIKNLNNRIHSVRFLISDKKCPKY